MNPDTTLTIGSIVVTGAPIALGASGYELMAMGFDTIQRRRDTVTSPWVNGDTEVASVQGALTYGFRINAVAPTLGEAITLTAAVIVQCQQKDWQLTEAVETYTQTYDCRAAISIDAAYERNYYINARRTITVTIPVKRA